MSTATMGPPQAPIDVVLARLAQRTGYEPTPGQRIGSWRGDCPIRHDEVNTLVVKTARDGRVMLLCDRGCSSDAIAGALDLEVRDLFPVPPQITRDPAPAADGGLPPAIRAIDAPDPEPITWCVEELLIAGELAVFAGDGGSFKSTAAFHIAGAIAGGYAAFNRFPTRQRPTLILSAEDGAGVVLNRLEALVAGHGWDRERVLSNVHVIASHDAKLSNPAWQRHLLAEAQRLEVGFIQCDPLFDLVDGDENSNSDLRPVIRFCRKLATATDAAVAIVHHATKVKPDQRAIDRVRGASALRDASRCLLFFESRPEGIAVEHLKMSRSERLAPFMLTREIESDPESRAIWSSARFSFQTTSDAVLSRVESFLLDRITAAPGELKSGDLRHAAGGEGIRGEDVSKGISHLQARGLIDYELGPRNSRFWRPAGESVLKTTQTRNSGQARAGSETSQSTLPRVVRAGSQTPPPSRSHPAPLKGGWQGGPADRSGQADDDDAELEL